MGDMLHVALCTIDVQRLVPMCHLTWTYFNACNVQASQIDLLDFGFRHVCRIWYRIEEDHLHCLAGGKSLS